MSPANLLVRLGRAPGLKVLDISYGNAAHIAARALGDYLLRDAGGWIGRAKDRDSFVTKRARVTDENEFGRHWGPAWA